MRLAMIRQVIVVLFALMAGYLFYLQVIRGGYFLRQSVGNAIRVVPFEGARGLIVDRNGKILAESGRGYYAAVIPQDIKDKKALFSFMADVLGVEKRVVEARYLKNKLTPFAPVTLAEDLTRPQAIRIEENSFRFPGLMVLEKFFRKYPYRAAAGHLTGYCGRVDPFKVKMIAGYGYSAEELVGYSGIEEFYDDFLRGIPGGRQIEVNSRGQQTRLLSVRVPQAGKKLMLTIDIDVQKAASVALAGRRGAVVVMDPENGEVLALVSGPAFDPNAFVDRDQGDLVRSYLQSTQSPLMNRAVSGAFQPGSVFKIPVSLGGLEEFKIKPSTTFDCPGYFQMGDRTYRFPHSWGPQNLTEAMAHSANEYFFHAGLMLGAPSLAHYARLFGLGSRTGIDLPYESRGSVPSGLKAGGWFKGDTLNMSIGQGDVTATPVQIARLIAAVETEGALPHPHLVVPAFGQMKDFQPVHISFRKPVWDAVKEGLRQVVLSDTGTAHALADIAGVNTYGKTGTAQTGAGREDHAWFAGVSRTDKRVIAYCVFLEHGGSSANAVQLTKELLISLREQGKI
jgi:penicillin-binding protein 2